MFIFRLPYAIISWFVVSSVSIGLRIFAPVVVAVALLFKINMENLWYWGDWEANPKGRNTYLHHAFMAAGHNLRNTWTPEYKTYGSAYLDCNDGFQWRYRHSRWSDGLSVTFGKQVKGTKYKRGFTIGWAMSEIGPMRFTLFSTNPTLRNNTGPTRKHK